MTGLHVTKQQFSEAVKKFGIGFIPSGRIYESIKEAGFVLVDKQALSALDFEVRVLERWLKLWKTDLETVWYRDAKDHIEKMRALLVEEENKQ